MVFISIIAKLIKHKEEFHIPNNFFIKKLFQSNRFLYKFYKNNYMNLFNINN